MVTRLAPFGLNQVLLILLMLLILIQRLVHRESELAKHSRVMESNHECIDELGYIVI